MDSTAWMAQPNFGISPSKMHGKGQGESPAGRAQDLRHGVLSSAPRSVPLHKERRYRVGLGRAGLGVPRCRALGWLPGTPARHTGGTEQPSPPRGRHTGVERGLQSGTHRENADSELREV